VVGTEQQQEAVGLPMKLVLHFIVHVVRIVRQQLIDDELLRQLDLHTQWRQNEFESGGGHQSGAKCQNNIVWSCPSTSLALKVQLVVLVGAFVMVSIQFGQFLFFAVLLLTVPPCPAICKSGGHVPPVPYGVDATVRTTSPTYQVAQKKTSRCCRIINQLLPPTETIATAYRHSAAAMLFRYVKDIHAPVLFFVFLHVLPCFLRYNLTAKKSCS